MKALAQSAELAGEEMLSFRKVKSLEILEGAERLDDVVVKADRT